LQSEPSYATIVVEELTGRARFIVIGKVPNSRSYRDARLLFAPGNSTACGRRGDPASMELILLLTAAFEYHPRVARLDRYSPGLSLFR
jgi:hypothetical protein